MTERKKQFKKAINHMKMMMDKAIVNVEDVKYLLDSSYKLLLSFEDMEQSRSKWRVRAEKAEQKLKDAFP